ncbi:STAS domain-containing protein [Alsobacter sp. R-9]
MDLALTSEPTRDEIFEVYGKMKDAFAANDNVRLHVAEVNRLTPALAQLIIAAGRAAPGREGAFTLVSPTAGLVDGFQALGLFADFMTVGME